MTDHAERILLARHGTVDVALPPRAILAAAKEDFERRMRNKIRAETDGKDDFGGSYERYCFLGSHVRDAKSPADILKAALKWKRNPKKHEPIGADEDGNPIWPEHGLSLLHLTASIENLALAIQLAEEMNRIEEG